MIEKLLLVPALLAVALYAGARLALQLLLLPLWALRMLFAKRAEWAVVCLSHVPWNHIWQRNHHTMTQLAQRRPVVYFQHSGFSYIHSFSKALAWSLVRKGELGKLLFPRDPRGVRIRQLLLLPGESRIAFVAALNSAWVAFEVLYERVRTGCGTYALWFYYPAGVGALRYLSPASVVYDIQDQYTAFAWAPRDIGAREQRILAQADVVFPGTLALHEARAHANKHFFPCAVEFDHFHAAAPPQGRERHRPPAPIAEVAGKHPLLMFAGLIDARIDGALLRHIAEREPDWRLVMIGPVDAKLFNAANMPANILFVGAQPYRDLPQWFAWADVLTMPWAVNELTEHINPTKTLEYYAAGKPVVATAIPDLRRLHADACLLAESAEEFRALCREAISHANAERLAIGMERARGFAWTEIVRQMERHVEDSMGAR